jgi:hypothetical protein
MPARLARAMLAAGVSALHSAGASAHVKWFCAFDVAGQPRGLENVLCPDFEQLVGLAISVLFIGCVIEGTLVGEALRRALDRVTNGIGASGDLLLRAVLGFFFVSLWSVGGIILTPELKTSVAAISWLQLAIAAGLAWQRMLPFSGFGIVVLFVIATSNYGLFHLMDYPLFLGLAAYLALTGLERTPLGLRPLDVLRYSVAITLMWASVEKWAYPQWSFPLFVTHPSMTLGFEEEFFMRAAGVVEFTLSFALLLTPLVRRSAAIMLLAMFVSAVLEFGKIDLIGHSPIIVALLLIIGDQVGLAASKRHLISVPIGYAAALAGSLAVYYVAHELIFGTAIL